MKKMAIAGLLAAALSLAPLSQSARADCGFSFGINVSVSGSFWCHPCCCNPCGISCGEGFGFTPEACGYGSGGYCAAAPYAAPYAAPVAAPAAAPAAVQNAAYYYPAAGYGYSYYGAPGYWYGH